ncbi:MAG TPA: hypothetical protein VJO54_15620 [Burkholderiales bacterium]|nr:hypothetical protein [Burkholderiales bacterium]
MAPGSWATFPTQFEGKGTLSSLIDAGDGHRITEYADKMVWFPGRHEIHFTGGGHASNEKTIVYTEIDNTWHDLGTPPWYVKSSGGAVHGYQHNAGDGNTDYYLHFGGATIHTRDAASGTWGVLDTGIRLGSGGAIGALEWFPTFGSGSLIIVNGNADGVYRWNGRSWSNIARLPAMGRYHNVAVYSPIKDLMYFGGGNGSQQLYTLSRTGKITPRASCPVGFGINQSVTTIDPASGKLLLACYDKVIRIYDPDTDAWSTDTAPPPAFWSGNMYSEGQVMGIVAAPVYDHGVTMFIAISGPAIYLRKGR